MAVLVWFRSDLRTGDHTALAAACKAHEQVNALFIISSEQWREHHWGDNKACFITRAVTALSQDLRRLNIPLLFREVPRFADVPRAITDLAHEHELTHLYYNREYEVNELARDEKVTQACEEQGIEVSAFHDQTIIPPALVRTRDDRFFSVYSPFRKAWQAVIDAGHQWRPVATPGKRTRMMVKPDPVPREPPGYTCDDSIAELWPASEAEAKRRLQGFIKQGLDRYKKQRDCPAVDGTSTLSPYLAAGLISPRVCMAAAVDANDGRMDTGRQGPTTWINELIWREFYRHVLVGFPHVCRNLPFKRETRALPWRCDRGLFECWCQGQTGYPIVDAAMRQLNSTGWMHNRLRMIAAMFLTKDLLIDWQWGERYFMQHLVDADFASNNGGWQWSASVGTDAAPYFRIFNPTTQGKRFDPDATFIRRYCPEFSSIEAQAIHDPQKLPPRAREGLDYPRPIVDHASARQAAIEMFQKANA